MVGLGQGGDLSQQVGVDHIGAGVGVLGVLNKANKTEKISINQCSSPKANYNSLQCMSFQCYLEKGFKCSKTVTE